MGKRTGDLLENIVYLELKRQFDEIYYFKTAQNYEVDFLVKDREKITHLIQVSQTLVDERTKKRELRALVKALKELAYTEDTKLLLITMDDGCVDLGDGGEIEVMNVLEWLLLI